MNVTFTSSTLQDKDDGNLVGTIIEEGQLKQMIDAKARITRKKLPVVYFQ